MNALAPSGERARPPNGRAALERALSRYRPDFQTRVRRIARAHPWIADLALSFPAVLFAIAMPRQGIDARAIARLAVEGAPLAALAGAAGIPLWLRPFPAEAFAARIPALPDGVDFRRRIANHFPKRWKDAPVWCKNLAQAARWCDEDFALWIAREAPLKPPKARRRHRRISPRHNLMWLWAWYSQRPDLFASHFVETPWRPEMQWDAAFEGARAWSAKLTLPLYLGAGAIADMWLAEGACDGYAIRPLATADAIAAEAAAMRHCVGSYGDFIASNETRVWSVTKDGARVATLSIGQRSGEPFPSITELAGAGNAPVSKAAWRAVRRWLHAQDSLEVDSARVITIPDRFDQATWRALWRPYWIAQRSVPDWLPLCARTDAFYAL